MKSKDEMMIDEFAEEYEKHLWRNSTYIESDTRKDFKAGFQAGQASERAKVREVLNYCKPHTEQMWAARIVGVLLGCDFRDAKEALAAYESEGSGE